MGIPCSDFWNECIEEERPLDNFRGTLSLQNRFFESEIRLIGCGFSARNNELLIAATERDAEQLPLVAGSGR